MTTQAGLTPIDMMSAEGAANERPRTYAAQVLHDTFVRWPAKLGLAWIALLGFLAVFGPLIANSHPMLIEMKGQWSSPMLKSLTWTDITLIVSTFAGVFLYFSNRIRKRNKFWILVVVIFVASLVTYFLRPEQPNIVYEKYREAQAAGLVQHVLNAPIPYSASDRLRDQSNVRLMPPSSSHLFGTEENGGDVLSRLTHACRIAMSIGFVSTGIAIVIGVFIGGIMGYFAGAVDIIGMRLIEIFEAIPTLFLMITLVAFFNGESYRLYMLMAIIGVTGWTGYARFLRAEFLTLRNQDFVHAAIAAGLPLRSVLFRHMLPNGITAVVISASFSVAGAIVAESTLSFLDLGLIDQPSWGAMLSQSIGQGGNFLWWLAVFPGAAIFVTVFAYNVVGEALTDALDPKRRGG